MRISISKEGRGRFCLIIPLGFVATKIGSAIAAGMVNRGLAEEQKPALPEATDQDQDVPSVLPSTQCQSKAITPLQMRQIGRALKENATFLQETGLPLVELHSSEGTFIKVDL